MMMMLNKKRFNAALDKDLNRGTNTMTIHSPLIIALLDIPAGEYGMLSIIYEYSKHSGECTLSEKKFGAMLCKADEQPIRGFREKLIDKGYITTTKDKKTGGYTYFPSEAVLAMFNAYRFCFIDNKHTKAHTLFKKEEKFKYLLNKISDGNLPTYDWEKWDLIWDEQPEPEEIKEDPEEVTEHSEPNPTDDLEEMNLSQLMELADSKGIDYEEYAKDKTLSKEVLLDLINGSED